MPWVPLGIAKRLKKLVCAHSGGDELALTTPTKVSRPSILGLTWILKTTRGELNLLAPCHLGDDGLFHQTVEP